MAFWTTDFISYMRQSWFKNVCKIQYYNGTKWTDATIVESGILDTGVMYFNVSTDTDDTLTITSMRILNERNETIGSQAVNLVKKSSNGILIRFEFPLYELES